MDPDEFIAHELSKIYGFKQGLATLIHKYGLGKTNNISDVLLAELIYDSMIHMLRVSRVL